VNVQKNTQVFHFDLWRYCWPYLEMTVVYSSQVITSSFACFLKLLLRWVIFC